MVFILAVYFTYFVPFLLLIAVVARRLAPNRSEHAAVVAVVATLATPACWYHVLQGYPDVVGAALMAGCALVYGRWASQGGIAAPVLLGGLAGLSVVLRRHYAYAVVALYAGIVLDQLLGVFRTRGESPPRRRLVRALACLLAAVGSTGGLIYLLVPNFFAKAASSGGKFAPWEQTVLRTLESTVGTVGAGPLLLRAVGWGWTWRKVGLNRGEVRLPLLAALVWVVVWASLARQQPYHYPHWLPMAVVLGLAALWLRTEEVARPTPRRLLLAVTAGVVAAAWIFCMPLPAIDPPHATPFHVFPDRMQRLSNPAYAAIVDLVTFLRNAADAEDTVLVAASSRVLNLDILRFGGAACSVVAAPAYGSFSPLRSIPKGSFRPTCS